MAALRRLSFLALLLATTSGYAQDIAVRGQTIHTSAGETIDNGIIVIRDGKITAVGPAASVSLPDGIRVVEATVVTPGLIDAHTVVGLAGALNQPHDQDQLERSEAIQPELRALDAYNSREVLIDWLRDFGITTIHTGHAPGEIISGQTLIAKTYGDTVEEAVIVPAKMIAATLGESAFPDPQGGRKSPGTRGKAAAMLRSELAAARNYVDALEAASEDGDAEPPDRDLRKEALAKVLAGSMPLLVTANRHQDIMTALRIASEFDIEIVLDGAAEAYLLVDEIRDAGIPVILHPTMARAYGERENMSLATAGNLISAGIPVAMQSGYETYVPKTRVVLFEAGQALPYGLTFDQALATITIGAARILGIDDRVGSIETGKDGDLALFDGDPFEYTTHSTGTIIDGRLVSETVR